MKTILKMKKYIQRKIKMSSNATILTFNDRCLTVFNEDPLNLDGHNVEVISMDAFHVTL